MATMDTNTRSFTGVTHQTTPKPERIFSICGCYRLLQLVQSRALLHVRNFSKNLTIKIHRRSFPCSVKVR
ncbi:hypothetical protein WA026_006131 [Henosepilachna vigintioctopunctata]|uniref:Uncharacterized protein n=1 Tax=Henosepilachna vigintioctopunctata TaxID=420089 RepID=A0AAW1TPE1_9CUCU